MTDWSEVRGHGRTRVRPLTPVPVAGLEAELRKVDDANRILRAQVRELEKALQQADRELSDGFETAAKRTVRNALNEGTKFSGPIDSRGWQHPDLWPQPDAD